MRGRVDAYNDRQVARRSHLSAAELLDEFERNRAATIRAVEAAGEELFGRRLGRRVCGRSEERFRYVTARDLRACIAFIPGSLHPKSERAAATTTPA